MDKPNSGKNIWDKYFNLQTNMTKSPDVIPRHSNKHIKILSLGTGSSGKATIFKQLKYIYNLNNINEDISWATSAIRQNCVAGIIYLLRKYNDLVNIHPEMFDRPLINMGDDVAVHIQLILQYSSESFNEVLNYEVSKLGKAIALIWSLDAIYKTWELHWSGMYSFVNNMDYFFNKVTDIMNTKYLPSKEDVLKLRLRTTGMSECIWTVDSGHTFYFYHTGGQRNERLKWIHHMEGISCVFFVIGLDHFCKALFEDQEKNALLEAVEVFEEVSKLKYLRFSKMVVILAKTDIFERCLKYNSLKMCFGDYYKGPIFRKQDFDRWIRMIQLIWPNIDIDIGRFPIDVIQFVLLYCGHLWKWDPDFKQGIQFIKEIILRIRPDTMVYELCSLNADEVKGVMEDIQQDIIKSCDKIPKLNYF